MAASVSGAKTVTTDVSPTMSASALTTILAVAPENMTVAQLTTLMHALDHIPFGKDPAKVIGTLLV